jgi:hypothetical protein
LAQKSGKHENRRRPEPKRPETKGRVTTMRYEERPRTPSSRRMPYGSSPELITIDEVGRATLTAIEEALRAERLEAEQVHSRPDSAGVPEEAVIFEISTFVVEGAEVFGKVQERQRREFVERRLMHRLPVTSMDQVTRIDLTPGVTPSTMILRVWSRVDARGK